ncbi:hypothetical protein GCM10027586_01470 [Kineococcus gypseus]|uniref:hypothetical protein n=1 Tax=Kineococcus gypseus TaxID=1637102 RepID=UPI003D7EBE92
MIVRDGSPYVPAMPTLPSFRVLGLAPSHPGARGVALWNPLEPPVLSVTLSHGHLDLATGPGVHVTSQLAATSAPFTASALRPGDVVLTSLLSLPGTSVAEAERTAALLYQPHPAAGAGAGASPAWRNVQVPVDGVPTAFRQHQHRSTQHWVAVAEVGEVCIALLAHAIDVDDLALVTVDADLPGYECAAPTSPRRQR